MKILGKKVLITGASNGIGAATAKEMAKRGAEVILLARTEVDLKKVADEIKAQGGKAYVYPVDLSKFPEVRDVCKKIESEVGTPDIIFNNVGIGRWLYMEETPPEEIVQMLSLPFFAAFWVTQFFMPKMLKRKSGHIVVMSTPAAYYRLPGAMGYSVARWAMRGFAESLTADLKGTGIGVTLVVPGFVKTDYFTHNPGVTERIPKIAKLIPLLTAEDVGLEVLRGIEHEKQLIIIPFLLKFIMVIHRFVPSLGNWLIVKTGWKRTGA